MEEEEISEVWCECCGKHYEVTDDLKLFIDDSLLNFFGYVFCDEDCYQNFMDSK